MRYLIKETFTANERNDKMRGETLTIYHGTNGYIDYDGDKVFASIHGYERKCNAVRQANALKSFVEHFWDKAVEIIEYNI